MKSDGELSINCSLVETSSVYSDNDPCVREEDVGLFEQSDVFESSWISKYVGPFFGVEFHFYGSLL